MIHPHNRRTRFWIDPAFQGRLVAGVVGAVVALFLAYLILHRFLFWRIEWLVLDAGISRGSPLLLGLERLKVFMSTLMLIASGAIATLGAVYVIFISHRVVGPIYKLKWYLGKVSSGEGLLGFKLSFRETDHFREIPELVNGALTQRQMTAIHKRNSAG